MMTKWGQPFLYVNITPSFQHLLLGWEGSHWEWWNTNRRMSFYRDTTQYNFKLGWNTIETGFMYTQVEYIQESLNTNKAQIKFWECVDANWTQTPLRVLEYSWERLNIIREWVYGYPNQLHLRELEYNPMLEETSGLACTSSRNV